MNKSSRLKQIEIMLQKNGKVGTNQLCRLFNVSEMTIRRDLNLLAEQNAAIRSHGGAILPVDNILTERPYDLRINHKLTEKRAIAREAIKLINDGDCVFFDSSTTTFSAAELITNEFSILATTDTLTTAIELNRRPNVKVISIGGELQKSSHSCSGYFSTKMLEEMHFDIAFLGFSGISKDGFLSTQSTNELALKRSVISRTSRSVVLVDSSKLGISEQYLQIAHLSNVDTLITDSRIEPAFIEYCQNLSIHLIIAPIG